MATEKQLVDQRERKIKSDDLGDNVYLTTLSKGTTGIIAEKLKYFRDRYATDGVLSISDMRTNVNSTDFEMWQSFVKKYGKRLLRNAEAKYRLDEAKQTAGLDRAHLMSSIVAIAVAYSVIGTTDYFNDSLMDEANQAMNFQNKVSRARGNDIKDSAEDVEREAKSFIDQETQGLTLSDRTWLRADKVVDQSNNAIDRAYQHGLDDGYYQDHLFNDGQVGNQNSIMSVFKSYGKYLNAALIDAKARIADQSADVTAEKNKLRQGYWHTVADNKVCKLCDTLSMEGPYKRSEIPPKPHPNCRCFIVYY